MLEYEQGTAGIRKVKDVNLKISRDDSSYARAYKLVTGIYKHKVKYQNVLL